MRTTQLRQVDLNLLVIFAVLAEERNVSRAAKRIRLSQPAVTRALKRLRDTFKDDLLVRTSGDYDLTPRGHNLLRELEMMLPRLDRLIVGAAFDPDVEQASFHLAGTDYASQIICVPLSKALMSAGKLLSFDVAPLNDTVFDAMERGRIDLLFHADDGHVPPNYPREIIFEEEFVCIVARDYPCNKRLSQQLYLNGNHVGVTIFGGKQTIPEQVLKAAGMYRHCSFTFPFFSVAARSVAGTKLIATIPKRLAEYERQNSALKILEPPKVFARFKYLMTWHPRMNTDAGHIWLRDNVRQIGKVLSAEICSS